MTTIEKTDLYYPEIRQEDCEELHGPCGLDFECECCPIITNQ